MHIKKLMVGMGILALSGCVEAPPPAASASASASTSTFAKVASKSVPEDPSSIQADENYKELKLIAKAAGTVVASNASELNSHVYNLDMAAKAQMYGTMDHIADWLRPTKPKPNQAIAASYCYRMLGDIACYRAPMPGWENRLVGYQGTGAEPPKPAVMELLPTHTADASNLPENRAKDAKPVFVSKPQDVKSTVHDDDSTDTETTHEQVADPATAPQL